MMRGNCVKGAKEKNYSRPKMWDTKKQREATDKMHPQAQASMQKAMNEAWLGKK